MFIPQVHFFVNLSLEVYFVWWYRAFVVEIAKTNELEVQLLRQLEKDVDNDKLVIKSAQKRIDENQDVIDALRAKLGEAAALNSDDHSPSQTEMVKIAVHSISIPRFTQRDIEQEIRNAFPDHVTSPERIRSILWHLQKNKDLITRVKQGNNQATAEYAKLPSLINGHAIAASGTIVNNSARRSVGVASNSGSLTVGQLEDLIRKKSRRVKDVAEHFGVTESIVNQLLDPASKVYMASRGWLKIRENNEI